MSCIRRELVKDFVTVYNVEIEDGKPYMVLSEVEYRCCNHNQYTDLSLVPISAVMISCSHCNDDVYQLEEFDFKIELIPVDEVYDHVGEVFLD